MCSADAIGIHDQITGDPEIPFCNGYFLVYLLIKPKELCCVKNNRGTSLIGEASYDQILRCRATFHIDVYVFESIHF